MSAKRTRIPPNFDAIARSLKSKSPKARIERLRRHEELQLTANLLAEADRNATTSIGRMVVLNDISGAEQEALKLDALPHVQRDKARQEGTKKGRRPDITEWISAELRRDPPVKSPALWNRAPEWLTDQIGYERFRKRVTAVRKGR